MLYHRVIADYKAFSRKAFKRDAQLFIDLLMMQDQLLGTRQEFRLGNRLSQARRCGTTVAEKDLYEWNARVQVTTWGNLCPQRVAGTAVRLLCGEVADLFPVAR